MTEDLPVYETDFHIKPVPCWRCKTDKYLRIVKKVYSDGSISAHLECKQCGLKSKTTFGDVGVSEEIVIEDVITTYNKDIDFLRKCGEIE